MYTFVCILLNFCMLHFECDDKNYQVLLITICFIVTENNTLIWNAIEFVALMKTVEIVYKDRIVLTWILLSNTQKTEL